MLIGRLSLEEMTEQQEPYESRDSRTDLWGPRGEIPLGYPTDLAICIFSSQASLNVA